MYELTGYVETYVKDPDGLKWDAVKEFEWHQVEGGQNATAETPTTDESDDSPKDAADAAEKSDAETSDAQE